MSRQPFEVDGIVYDSMMDYDGEFRRGFFTIKDDYPTNADGSAALTEAYTPYIEPDSFEQRWYDQPIRRDHLYEPD